MERPFFAYPEFCPAGLQTSTVKEVLKVIEMYKYIPNVFSVRASVESLPKGIRDILNCLRNKREVVITGRVARWVLRKGLEEQGKKPILPRVGQSNKIELKIGHYDTLPKSQEEVIQKSNELKKLLGDSLSKNNLVLDFDSMNFSTEDEAISKKTIVALLSNMDISVNEVILAPKNGVWYLYYTERCWSHTLKGLGILCYKEGFVRRERNGIIVPNSNGLYRLLKAFTEGEVRKIVVPRYQMDLYLQHMKKLQKSRKVSKGANLGRYALILIEKFQNDPAAQKRLMYAMHTLGLTKETDFGKWASAQQLLNRFNNGTFDFGGLSFKKKLAKDVETIRIKEKGEAERKQKRDGCHHNFQTEKCEKCPDKCVTKTCSCGKYETGRRELPCNIAFIDGIYSPKQKSIFV